MRPDILTRWLQRPDEVLLDDGGPEAQGQHAYHCAPTQVYLDDAGVWRCLQCHVVLPPLPEGE